MKDLAPNSLGIPRSQLTAFIGSETLADECAAALTPTVKRKKCVLFDRSEVREWYRKNILEARDRRGGPRV